MLFGPGFETVGDSGVPKSPGSASRRKHSGNVNRLTPGPGLSVWAPQNLQFPLQCIHLQNHMLFGPHFETVGDGGVPRSPGSASRRKQSENTIRSSPGRGLSVSALQNLAFPCLMHTHQIQTLFGPGFAAVGGIAAPSSPGGASGRQQPGNAPLLPVGPRLSVSAPGNLELAAEGGRIILQGGQITTLRWTNHTMCDLSTWGWTNHMVCPPGGWTNHIGPNPNPNPGYTLVGLPLIHGMDEP